MNTYKILRAKYKQIDAVWWSIRFETLCLVKADTPEDALAEAKRRGIYGPVVELAGERLQ